MKKISISLFFLLTIMGYHSQEKITNKKGSEYEFEVVKELEANPVQNQNRTGTCWSFSSLSFFESELQRLGKGSHNLSEMYIVRNAYIGKAENYLRMYGTFTFGQGGAFHDIPWVIKRCGIVPESAYDGLDYGSKIHLHEEMEKIMFAMLKELAKKPQSGKLTPKWKTAFEGVVDAYLGDLPTNLSDFKFEVGDKTYNPFTYAEELDLNMQDYVSLTSYTHHPFYESFVLEVQDNWAMQQSYNLPLDELMMVMEEAIMNGYTFAWGADVSEKGFSSRDALAILPADESTISQKGKDNRYFSSAGSEKISNAFMSPVNEKNISQQERQEAFDSQESTDDHGMHITGLVKDQKGTKYFKVKNSWGTEYNQCDGYFYASFPYVRYKTINILLHKDAVPKSIKKKLGL
ncbi:MAG: C1 family peptidase [Bacteroidota bacterium]|nr:C1 family peptidase [Bacteroidota bacterium]